MRGPSGWRAAVFPRKAQEIIVDATTRRATGVRLADGESLPADAVVCNGDVAQSYMRLVSSAMRPKNSDRRYERTRYSMSLFVIYFGTNRRYDDVAHHDFSQYLHRPTATDAWLAAPGCDSVYALSPVPHLGGETDWDIAAKPYRDAIMSYLEE